MRYAAKECLISSSLVVAFPVSAFCALEMPSATECDDLAKRIDQNEVLTGPEMDRYARCPLVNYIPPPETYIIPAWKERPENID